MAETTAWSAEDVFAAAPDGDGDIPLWLLRSGDATANAPFNDPERAWLAAQKFTGGAKKLVQLPTRDCTLASVALGLGDGAAGEPSGPSELLTGLLAQSLPATTYRFAEQPGHATLAAIAWGLGAYRFQRYRSGADTTAARPRLRIPAGVNAAHVINTTEAVWFGLSLIHI